MRRGHEGPTSLFTYTYGQRDGFGTTEFRIRVHFPPGACGEEDREEDRDNAFGSADGGPAARFVGDVKRLLEGGLENYMHMDTSELNTKKLSLDTALTS